MANTWWKIVVSCVPDLEEVAFFQFQQLGCAGTSHQIIDKNLLIEAYLPSSQIQLENLENLSLSLQQNAQELGKKLPTISWQLIAEEDWANSWKNYWQPQEIGKSLIAIASWLPAPENPNKILLRIDPEMAFGTGNHTTTQMCLEVLETLTINLELPAQTIVADIGCGSGILAIAAILFKAQQVYAVDIDPLAIRATISNRELNKINPEKIIVAEGSIEKLKAMISHRVDGILCNIMAEAIADLMPQMSTIIKPGGWAILSGITIDKVDLVNQAIVKSNWKIMQMYQQKEWCCFLVKYC